MMQNYQKIVRGIKHFVNNDIRVCELGLTNICTCKCSFCDIWKQEEKIILSKERAFKAIDRLYQLGVCHITLTGGEPLLNPNVIDIVKRCSERNIATSLLNADARLITPDKIQELEKAGLDYIAISIDSHDEKTIEASRKIRNLMQYIIKATKILKNSKINSIASILISKFNYKNLEELFKRTKELGFGLIAINYPEFSKSMVYPLGGEAVKFTNDEVITALEEIIKLKKSGEYNIVNPIESMSNIILYLKNKKVKYHCFGGCRVIFVDWFLDVYPCMHLPKKIGNLLELDKKDLKKMPCNECNMSWYRDFSIFFNGAKSIKPIADFLFKR